MDLFIDHPHFVIMFLSGLVSLLMAGILFVRKQLEGSIYLCLAFLSNAIWLFATSIETIVSTQADKVLWSKIEYLGVGNVLPFLTLFVIKYYLLKQKTLPKWLAIFWIIPLTVIFGAWTNELHGWVWPGFSTIDPITNLMVYEHGPLFWLSVMFIYFAVFVNLYILGREYFVYQQSIYRIQITLMLVGFLFPFIGSFIYISGASPIPGLNWVAMGAFLSTIIIAFSVLRYGVKGLMPIARDLLLERLDSGVLVIDAETRVIDYNQKLFNMLQIKNQDLIGLTVNNLFNSVGFRCDFPMHKEIWREEFVQDLDGRRYFEIKCSPIQSKGGQLRGWLMIFNNITLLREKEQELKITNQRLFQQLKETERLNLILEEQTVRDALTGLYNRRYFEETLEREISRANRKMHFLALLMLDIDFFKSVNDRFGHEVGDQVLSVMGEILSTRSRKEDIACRIGGEEFLLLMPDITVKAAQERAEEIRQQFTKRCRDLSDKVDSTVSIGISIYPQHADTSRVLFRRADQALYAAKHAGRNQVCIASSVSMDE